MIRAVANIFTTPLATIERTMEEDCQPVVRHVQHELVGLRYARICLGEINLGRKVVLPTTKLEAERYISNQLHCNTTAILFYSLHLCYAELVCFLASSKVREIAPIAADQKFQIQKRLCRVHIHDIGNIPGNLH
jgi:hypothetical protein